jgi:uncharacterized cupin superfamily protein
MTHATAPDALVLHPGEGEVIEVLGNRLVIKAAAPRVTLVDYTAPPGFAGPPLHVHTGFDEVFVVLEGTLTTRVGDETHEVPPGGTVFVAGDTPHTFTNATGDPLRVLVIWRRAASRTTFADWPPGIRMRLTEHRQRRDTPRRRRGRSNRLDG